MSHAPLVAGVQDHEAAVLQVVDPAVGDAPVVGAVDLRLERAEADLVHVLAGRRRAHGVGDLVAGLHVGAPLVRLDLAELAARRRPGPCPRWSTRTRASRRSSARTGSHRRRPRSRRARGWASAAAGAWSSPVGAGGRTAASGPRRAGRARALVGRWPFGRGEPAPCRGRLAGVGHGGCSGQGIRGAGTGPALAARRGVGDAARRVARLPWPRARPGREGAPTGGGGRGLAEPGPRPACRAGTRQGPPSRRSRSGLAEPGPDLGSGQPEEQQDREQRRRSAPRPAGRRAARAGRRGW